ncbi:hypothetical protein KKC94_03410, partial [Patescibacteria group bacterium]|nr:hypothetical protein [Patescibacteria group bacterium]
NPRTKQYKAMIEEDKAVIGLSVGARPFAYKKVKVNGDDRKMWTKAELLEGSLTPIPSNANCLIMAKAMLTE